MDSCSKFESDDSEGLKLLLDAPNPPQNQRILAFPVRSSAQVMLMNTLQGLLIPGIPQWNVEHPAAVAQNPEHTQPIDISGSSGRRVNDGGEFVVGSYRPPCPLHTYAWPQAITVIPDDAPHFEYHHRRTKSALF